MLLLGTPCARAMSGAVRWARLEILSDGTGLYAPSMADAMEQLAEVRRQFGDTSKRGHHLADPLDERTWASRPPDGGWSVAECFIHLNLTAERMLALCRDGLDRTRRESGSDGPRAAPGQAGALSRDLTGRLLAWYLEPPYRLKSRTQPAFVPAASAPKADVMASWDREHDAIDAFLTECAGWRIDKARIASPFDPRGRLRYSVYSALLVVAAHERRHLWQAERVLQRLEGARRAVRRADAPSP